MQDASPAQAPLLPKLRGHFAEFLNHSSPERLSILYLTTCVGLGYGPCMYIARGFSRQHGITDITHKGATHHVSHLYEGRIYLSPRATRLHHNPISGTATPLRHPITWLLPDQAPRTPRPHRAKPDTEGLWVVSITDSPWAHIHGYGNINPLSIDYACRPRLRSRLTLGRRT